MKKLLFLAGLIMVAAACTSSGSSFWSKSKEESKESNISFIILKKHKNGSCEYGICTSNYDASTQTLCMNLNGKEYSYGLSQINEEYYDQVKNNKVTFLISFGELVPAVVEKDETPYDELPLFEKDTRQFKLTSILKENSVSKPCHYLLVYNGMFMNGLTKIGRETYENGRFFFCDADFAPEYDDSKNDKGFLSAGLVANDSPNSFVRKDKRGEYKYALIQSYCEDGYLILKIEGGEIYKYPVKALSIKARFMMKKGELVSAYQLSTNRWVPVFFKIGVDETYGMEGLIFATENTYSMRSRTPLIYYSDFMLEKNIPTQHLPINYFFYYAKPK